MSTGWCKLCSAFGEAITIDLAGQRPLPNHCGSKAGVVPRQERTFRRNSEADVEQCRGQPSRQRLLPTRCRPFAVVLRTGLIGGGDSASLRLPAGASLSTIADVTLYRQSASRRF